MLFHIYENNNIVNNFGKLKNPNENVDLSYLNSKV